MIVFYLASGFLEALDIKPCETPTCTGVFLEF